MYKNLINEEMEKLGIYELRALARKVGVSSPTTKKRDELISAIKDIKAGRSQPNLNNKYGRPVKQLASQDDLLAKLIINGDSELEEKINSSTSTDSSYIKFEQDMPKSELPLNYNLISINGILRKTEKGAFYLLNYLTLSKKTYVLVDEQFVLQYNLMEGDLISGTAYLNSDKTYAKINTVDLINGVKFDVCNEPVERELIIPYKEIENDSIKFGQCKFKEVKDTDEGIEYINSKIENFNKQNIKCVVVALEISIETKLKLDKINNATLIVSTLEDTATFSYEKLCDSLKHSLSLFERNQNVVVFVLNVLNIFHILDVAFQNNLIGHCEKTEHMIRKIFAQTRASESSSVTLYALYYSNQKEFYKNEINDVLRIVQN